jgi:glycosyltransferase involved in cell wall biosynthesis
MKRIVLFTDTFPYHGVTEQTFILPELHALAKSFEDIILVPRYKRGNMAADLSFCDNMRIDDTYSLYVQKKIPTRLSLVKSIFTKSGILSIFRERRSMRKKQNLASLLQYITEVHNFQKWFNYFLLKNRINPSCVLFYTYWFHIETTGLALFLRDKAKIVTRAHGYDVYDERVLYRSSYLRNETLKYIFAVYTASLHGQDYLQMKFSKYAKKIQTQYLGGIKQYDVVTMHHTDSNLTFLSCARVHPVKRIWLMSALIIELAKNLPKYTIKWIHIGDGEDMGKVKSIISDLPLNLNVDFKGELSNDEVHKIYRDEIIDWTILTSKSEGCPIAIVESLSYGVPVIATDVGGIPEIINNSNGILLSENPTSSELIMKIIPFLTDKELYENLKKQAIKDYYSKFDANKNHFEFVKFIDEIYVS